MPSRDVAAIVLNYDGRALLEVVLPSLARQTHPDMRVTVVDNGSSDDSLEYLRASWPDVEVVEIPENVGVAAALNRGIQATRSTYVALLNNDLELDPDWTVRMVEGLEVRPDCGAVACKLLSYRQRDRIDAAGDEVTWAGTARRRGSGEIDAGQFEEPCEVFAPTAGAALYRRTALEDVGPFDESFFAYFEDADWGIRAQLAGYRCWYLPRAVAYHMGSETTKGERDPFYFALHRRNELALVVKDLPARQLVRRSPHIARHQLGQLVISARDGMLAVHLRALGRALAALPGWLRSRRRIQRGRRVPPSRLDRVMSRP